MPALVLFAFGLALQLVFVLAGPAGGAGWHVGFQGDAPEWQHLAHALADPGPDDDQQLSLPWRPPAMPWLVAAMWNGDPTTATFVRLLFALLGACVPPLLWLLLRAHVTAPVSRVAAGICAGATSLLLLGSGLHVEVLYLVGVLVALFEQPRLADERPRWAALRWGVLHGGLCLVRVDHAPTAAALAWLAWRCGARWRTLALAALASAVVLAPWQWHAHRQIAAYNAGAPALPPAPLPWDADAIARLRTLPGFQQLPTYGFVTDTMRVRGARRVAAADLDVVREAYGCFPEPLRAGFVACYGALNFFLANTPEADGGFSRKALDRPPPLTGGDALYPPGLRRVLPGPNDFKLSYPPHLDAVVNGFRRGVAEITADPLGALRRCAKKAWHTIEGMAPGLGHGALPIGASGVRRPVDLVTADGTWAAIWRVTVLAAAAFGLWQLRRIVALWPLLVFAATKLVVVVVWFGYARHGALCVPVVALGVAAALHRLAPRPAQAIARPALGITLLTLLLAHSLLHALVTTATVDGLPLGAGEPPGVTTRRIEFSAGR